MNDERMRDDGMSAEFQARMRRGLSTMAVRERQRERQRERRRRAMAAGALVAVVVAGGTALTIAVTGDGSREQDRAQPGTTETPDPAVLSTPGPLVTDAPSPTAPLEFEGVAAGTPQVFDVQTCTGVDDCVDQSAAGSAPADRIVDAYVLCESDGTVSQGARPWIDCSEQRPGSGFVQLHVAADASDADAEFTASPDFDGTLAVVETGQRPQGEAGSATATVYVTCLSTRGTITVGGVDFDCGLAQAPEGEFVESATLGAWGIPIQPGDLAPSIERDPRSVFVQVEYVAER